jgi:hypothetical protein
MLTLRTVSMAAEDFGQQHVGMSNMARLERIVARLPEAERVDIEAWGGEPTFRVRGKNFVFTDQEANGISVKLSKGEAAAMVATDALAWPTGYGLGRHGWVRSTWGRTLTSPGGSRSKSGCGRPM